MTPERYQQLTRWFNSMGDGSANVTPPTPEEADQWSRIQGGQESEPGSRVSNQRTGTARGSSTTGGTSNRVSGIRTGSTANEGQPIDVAHSTRVSNIRGTGTPATTSGTGRTTRGSSTSSPPSNEEATTEMSPTGHPERSAWSEFLRQAMEEARASGSMHNLRIPFEQHPRTGTFDRFQNVAQPGFGRPVQSTMPGQQQPVDAFPGLTRGIRPSQRGPMPPAMQDPRIQQLSPTLDPGSRTMTNFGDAMQRVQPMMQRPAQNSFPPQSMPDPRLADPRFSTQPMSMPSRSYSPPPSYRQREPNDAEMMMDRFRSTGSMY